MAVDAAGLRSQGGSDIRLKTARLSEPDYWKTWGRAGSRALQILRAQARLVPEASRVQVLRQVPMTSWPVSCKRMAHWQTAWMLRPCCTAEMTSRSLTSNVDSS